MTNGEVAAAQASRTNDLIWSALEDIQRRLSKLERVVDEGVPAYVAPMDMEVRKLIERVDELDQRTSKSVRLGPPRIGPSPYDLSSQSLVGSLRASHKRKLKSWNV